MEILGHADVLKYLCEGLKSRRLSPSLLFVGPDGVGKKLAALELAKCFACETKTKEEPGLTRCDQCDACRKVDSRNHPDILVIDRVWQAALLNEKSESQTAIKIESVRQLDQFLRLKPLEGQRRVVIVDEAQRLTVEAANALLKVLEEPPNNAQIILLGTDERGFPATVVSRCAVLRFKPLPSGIIQKWLAADEGMDSEKAAMAAERSGGSFSKALALAAESDEAAIDISDYKPDEFFDLIGQINWRKEGRKNAEKTLIYLIERSRKKLEEGDTSQEKRLAVLFRAAKQIERNVSPRLVLENLYMNLKP